ncbi:dentin sialophosphoprotein-like [Saccostrea echinata]|uniref:dentin sialophosphoprotein-like n=1 Tax=Saccostrea echinata TaxID=191078 RepID=UPI002A818E6F|nr:dentin sialophosphoprotein-like [Saccostrea echinata]
MDAKFEWLRKKTNISRQRTADPQNEFIRTEEYQPMKTDDPEAFSETEVRKMKKLSKRRTLLFIPSFRKKNIKLFREDSSLSGPKDNDSGQDSDSVNSGDSKGDNLSIRSSLSSLDSGFGSTTNSSSSLMSRVVSDIPDVIREESRGRAPIASPEDDSLLEDPSDGLGEEPTSAVKDDENSREDNSASSFHTLSDSCSCDSCGDSSSDSEGEDRVRVDDSSDSDSDLASVTRTVTPTSQRSTSTDSDSDSDLDECSSFFTQEKCFLPNASGKPRNPIVHTNSVNRGNRIKTNGSVIKRKSHQQLVTPLPTYARSHALPPTTAKACSSSSFSSSSAFKSFNSCSDFTDSVSSSRTVTSCDLIQRNRISYCEPDVIPKPVPKLSRSESERRSRSKLRSPILQVRNQSLNREVLKSIAVVPDLPPDSSKSPADIQQSMQNTAYWVSNSRYSSDPDDSTPLLKDKPDVSERELCQEIIGIYFGEDDSDSSLSSSCLDNSLDGQDSTSSSSSSGDSTYLPRTLETNLDDFSTAVYIPAKASEAHTRKINSAKVTKTKAAMKSKSDPPNHRSQGGTKLCCEEKPVPKLSEQEVDTITKLHTICNGQRIVRYLNMSELPMVHFPPPKRASRIIWNPDLEEVSLSHHSPRSTPTKPRSALRQRPKGFTFPFLEDKPSPIVITRVRRSKSMSRASKEWPW